MKFAKNLKSKLNRLIATMEKDVTPYVKNPSKDFTRKRNLTFSKTIKFILSIGGSSINKELLDFYNYSEDCVTNSAFVQQRDKISPLAFKHIFDEFNKTNGTNKLLKGYRLLAVDGTDLSIYADPDNTATYYKHKDSKAYALMHLNATFDLLNRKFLDVVISPSREDCERSALIQMANNYANKEKPIFVCDRGYESYNTIAHIQNNDNKYVIRAKDIHSNGMLKCFALPDCEFDITITRMITKRKTKEVNANLDYYKYLNPKVKFDFLEPKSKDLFLMFFRVVRFKISENTYETLITNLDNNEFSSTELKEIYNKRWGIEIAFRELKYDTGLSAFHSKKEDYILQEIYAKLIMYNFCELIISQLIINDNKKHIYKVNISVATKICFDFYRSKKNIITQLLETLIKRYISPVRPDRSFPRKTKSKSFNSFIYRIS